MERRSKTNKVMSDEEIRQHLLSMEDDTESVGGSSDDEDLVCDEVDDPLESIDVEDDQDPDFDPVDFSSSDSEMEVTDFDLELVEEEQTSYIQQSEIPSDVENDSAMDENSNSQKEKKSTPKPTKKRGKSNASGKQNTEQNCDAPGPSNAAQNQMTQRSCRKRKVLSRGEAGDAGDESGEVKKQRSGMRNMEELSENDCLITFDGPTVSGKARKDGSSFIWKTQPLPSNASVPKKNIVHIRPGPVGQARNVLEPVDCFRLFMTPEMRELIVMHTNEEISRISTNTATTKRIDSDEELDALIGLLIYSAARKDNHLPTTLLFDPRQCGIWYRASMSVKRFEFLLRALRFDDKHTRNPQDKFAPISELWKMFIEQCKSHYKPGSYVTIDEQLVGFRGNCPFRMFLPNKPAKYGLKLVAMVDASTYYLLDAIPYTGKGSSPPTEPAASYFVKHLVQSIENTNRNVTFDNWFTSIPLVSDLRKKGLTVVGTIRKNKIELPAPFLNLKFKNRKVGSSLFLFHEEMTAVSYKSKENKMVTLVSSMHDAPELHPFSKKPFIIHSYNATKGGVDTLDQLCSNYSSNRKTKRWPLCFFYNILNLACVNSFVIYQHNFERDQREKGRYISGEKAPKPLTRLQFMMKLHEQLTFAWKDLRLQQLSNLSIQLKAGIQESLKMSAIPSGISQAVPPSVETAQNTNTNESAPNNPTDDTNPEPVNPAAGTAPDHVAQKGEGESKKPRKKKEKIAGLCDFCPSNRHRKPSDQCFQCKRRICGEHIGKKLCHEC